MNEWMNSWRKEERAEAKNFMTTGKQRGTQRELPDKRQYPGMSWLWREGQKWRLSTGHWVGQKKDWEMQWHSQCSSGSGDTKMQIQMVPRWAERPGRPGAVQVLSRCWSGLRLRRFMGTGAPVVVWWLVLSCGWALWLWRGSQVIFLKKSSVEWSLVLC